MPISTSCFTPRFVWFSSSRRSSGFRIARVRGPYVDALIYLNPFYYFVEVVREPLLYGTIPWFEIAVLVIALPIGWLIASYLYARTRASVALWL